MDRNELVYIELLLFLDILNNASEAAFFLVLSIKESTHIWLLNEYLTISCFMLKRCQKVNQTHSVAGSIEVIKCLLELF